MPNKVFQELGTDKVRKSSFDLSRYQLTSGQMGDLIPTLVEEVLPGDEYKIRTDHMIRLAPMLYPLMHKVDAYIHYFFVPNRITWDSWETFITGGQNGTDEPTFPTVALTNTDNTADKIKLANWLGLPIDTIGQAGTSTTEVSQLPMRAYVAIWNEYYRDPNTVSEEILTNTSNFVSKKRAWEKDYFTSALPWAQRGTEISIPIELDYSATSTIYRNTAGALVADANLEAPSGTSSTVGGVMQESEGGLGVRVENLASGTEIDIRDLRRSNALQRWLELSARAGYRYTEQLKAFFGTNAGDDRLQRPEYLGGGKQTLQISEVLSTNESADVELGQLGGHGISVGQTNECYFKAPEHGYIMGILSVIPKTMYQQGIPRHWSRTEKFDYYWPQLAQIGEQEVLNQELYFDPADDAYNSDTFGYQQRYAEYKYGMDTVHGIFRDSLDTFHLGRQFSSQPTLSQSFLECDARTEIFNVTDDTEDNLWIQLYHQVHAKRPIPFFSNPQLQ